MSNYGCAHMIVWEGARSVIEAMDACPLCHARMELARQEAKMEMHMDVYLEYPHPVQPCEVCDRKPRVSKRETRAS